MLWQFHTIYFNKILFPSPPLLQDCPLSPYPSNSMFFLSRKKENCENIHTHNMECDYCYPTTPEDRAVWKSVWAVSVHQRQLILPLFLARGKSISPTLSSPLLVCLEFVQVLWMLARFHEFICASTLLCLENNMLWVLLSSAPSST